MSDIKWIKITTDIFDDEKILLIESLPEADSIIVIWFKLLCLAGKMNNSGIFMMNDKIAYTDKMLATIFRRKEATVQLALKTFEKFGMIEILDGVITIPNWNKHQTLDAYEKKKERDRLYRQERRAAQKALISQNAKKSSDGSSDKSPDRSLDVDALEEDKEREEDIDKESKEKVTCQQVVDLYHSICVSYPKVVRISEARKRAIRARLKVYTLEQIKTVFEKAEASMFMKGANKHNWTADFDWLLNDANITKVLEGKYDNGPWNKKAEEEWKASHGNKFNNFQQRQYDMGSLEQMLLENQSAGG